MLINGGAAGGRTAAINRRKAFITIESPLSRYGKTAADDGGIRIYRLLGVYTY